MNFKEIFASAGIDLPDEVENTPEGALGHLEANFVRLPENAAETLASFQSRQAAQEWVEQNLAELVQQTEAITEAIY